MNGLRTWVLQDLMHLIPKRQLQSGSIACLHTSLTSGRFWSFFEHSGRDGESLYKTKENENSENHVDFPGKMLALPGPRILELSAGKRETNEVVSRFNIKLNDFRNNVLPEPVKAIEDGSKKSIINEAVVLKAKEVQLEETKMEVKETIKDTNKNAVREEKIPILKMAETKSGLPGTSGRQLPKSWYDTPPRPSSVAPKNCPPPPQRPTFNPKPKCTAANHPKKPKNSSDPSKGPSHLPPKKCSFRKKYSSKSNTDLSKPSLNNNLKSSPIRMEKSPSGFVKDKGQSRLSLMVSAEIPRLRTTKSLPDQIVSRYSSGVAEPGLIKNSGKLGTRVSKSSNQVAHMSSGNGRKNRNRKGKKDCQKNQENPPPCSPPPPPPCCPPPPPCCPDPEVSSKPKKTPCSKTKTIKNKKNSCDDWCPENDDNECYTSKCPKRKKMSPKPRICPPNCFEPDPCRPARSFCVHPKKKGGKSFSTWTHQNSGMLFTYRSFASDPCKPMKKDEENVIRRIPKPGPVCKEAAVKSEDKSLKAAPVKKPEENKCKEPPKKSSQPSSTSGKQEEVTAANPKKGKFEEVQKSFVSDPCKQLKKDEENLIRRIPKPGPVCKQAAAKNGNNSLKAAPVKKPEKNKCKEPPKKSCQPSSTSGKQEELNAANLLKREFEEVQKCKQGRTEVKSESTPKEEKSEEKSTAKKSAETAVIEEAQKFKKGKTEVKSESKPKEEKSEEKSTAKKSAETAAIEEAQKFKQGRTQAKFEDQYKDKKSVEKSVAKKSPEKAANPTGLEKVISPVDPIGSPYKNLVGLPVMLQSDFPEDQKKANNYLPIIEPRSESWTNLIKLDYFDKGGLCGDLLAYKLINSQKSRSYGSRPGFTEKYPILEN